ncbi:hypothetical protein KP509_23G022400 [Ceratopteris richardii]|uniref:Dynein light chain 1, cytoplasmic n=1 Tax=Ceratopteris richardii TaxID=49495 RepID=A0A8T2RXY8_CERRI|nr:hypothetical protein KP509_23G022400 [Ceratopteris richardii]KAH7301377.1 hypothetical protein KP509_23G022400 [Ceratopteris richardii]
MASTESTQSKAAILMDAARRSQFIAKLQKYEAKVKQEQRRRALQEMEKQKVTMTLIEEEPTTWQRVDVSLLSRIQGGNEDFDVRTNQSVDGVVSGSILDVDIKSAEGDHLGSSSKAGGPNKAASTRVDINISGLSLADANPPEQPHIVYKSPTSLDVNIIAIATALEISIKKADMAVTMQEHAFRCARECLSAPGKPMSKHTAHTLKKEFDRAYGPAWHCIVGRSFGSYVTHSVGGFLYFSFGKTSVLLFKTLVESMEH